MLYCILIEHKVSLETFKRIEAALIDFDNNTGGRIIPWLTDKSPPLLIIPSYLVCDRANTQSVCQESGKTATQLLQCPQSKMRLPISSCSEGRTRGMFILHHFFNWCIYTLFLTLVSDGELQWPKLKFPDLFAQSDVNLFNHLVRKADVAGCVLRVLFFVDMGLPRIQCRWFVLSEVVLR